MNLQKNHRIRQIFQQFSLVLKLGYICPFQFFRQNVTKIRVTKLDLCLYVTYVYSKFRDDCLL